MSDWRDDLLSEVGTAATPAPVGRNPIAWPGYQPEPSVRWGRGPVAGVDVIAVWWNFSAYGGSFGEDDATSLVAAVDAAVAAGRPLVSFLRSGGTRLQEGMAALVGIPRARLALRRLAEAGLAHLAVCDQPTTGGVWLAVGSMADLRVGVAGSTVGFAGPRVAAAMTGVETPAGANTAESAYAAGLLDAVLEGREIGLWLHVALRATGSAPTPAVSAAATAPVADPRPTAAAPDRSGSAQVRAAHAARLGGAEVVGLLLDLTVPLRAPRADNSVAAVVGLLTGQPVVAVALAAAARGRPTPDGYRLLRRAAELADRIGLPLLTLIDTPGADPGQDAEDDGVAPAIGAALDAVLACRSPTIALVHGEGGSGGAIAAAATDAVLVTAEAYFAALGPVGAAVALRLSEDEVADRMAVAPADLLQLGFADALVDSPTPAAAAGLRDALADRLSVLAGRDAEDRLAARRRRWAAPLPGGG